MGSLELLSYFWSLNTILLVKIANFDFGGLTYRPISVEEVNMRKSQKGKGGKCLGLDPTLKVDQVNMGPDAAYSTMTSLDLSTTKKV